MIKKIIVQPLTKALIFDIDGTLADTMPAHFAVYKKILGKYGIDFSEELFNSLAGMPVLPQMKLMKERFNPENFDPEQVAIDKENEYYFTIEACKPIRPVLDVFDTYHGKMPIGCGTGGEHRIATRTLEVLGILDKIDALVTSDDVEHGKPAPDTFLKCAQMMGVDPQFCQVFEDGDPGIEAAKAAGMMVTDIREFI